MTSKRERRSYTNEELGIDPEREGTIIRIVIGAMLVLLALGALLMFVAFMLDTTIPEPQPSEPATTAPANGAAAFAPDAERGSLADRGGTA